MIAKELKRMGELCTEISEVCSLKTYAVYALLRKIYGGGSQYIISTPPRNKDIIIQIKPSKKECKVHVVIMVGVVCDG